MTVIGKIVQKADGLNAIDDAKTHRIICNMLWPFLHAKFK